MVTNLAQLIEETANKYQDSTFCEIKRILRIERYSFGEINLQSKKLAAYLKTEGVKKGDRILIWGPNCPQWIITFFASLRLGAVAVPVDIATSSETAKKFIEQTQPKKLFISKFISAQSIHPKDNIIALEEVIEISKNLTPSRDEKISENDLAEILFTSGTTGFPKGVELTHKSILYSITSISQRFPATRDLKSLSILPLSHIFEQIAGLFLPFSVGAQIAYLTRINSATILRGLKLHKVTNMLVVPRVLNLLLAAIEREVQEEHRYLLYKGLLSISFIVPSYNIRKILFWRVHKALGGNFRFFACGGAPIEKDTAKDLETMGIHVYQGYGSTETAALTTINLDGGSKITSAGLRAPHTEIKVAEDGEILVKSPTLFKGYWKNPEKTKEAFDGEWYKTGDIGKIDNNGFLFLLGREKFRIILPSGLKVYPEDIESKLNNHPKVKDSCVLGILNDKEIALFATIITDYPKLIDKIIEDVNKKLENSQQIYHYSAWPAEDFPRLRNLKVDRVKVEEIITNNSSEKFQQDEQQKKNKKIDMVVEIVAEIAQKDSSEIKAATNLSSDLKFDSLKRVELISRIEEELGVVVAESSINSETTIEKLREICKHSQKIIERVRPNWPRWNTATVIRSFLQNFFLFPLHSIFVKINIQNPQFLSQASDPAIYYINHTVAHDMLAVLRIIPPKRRKKIAIIADSWIWDKRFMGGFVMEILVNGIAFAKHGPGKGESLEFAAHLIDQGYSLLIAPEGQVTHDGKLLPFKNGTGLIAVEFGTDLVPIKVEGYRKIFPGKFGTILEAIPHRRGTIDIKVGKPLNFKDTKDYNLATQKMREAMLKL